jgi:stage II sporulation protein D
VAIRDSDGMNKEMKGSSFRMAIGPDVIRSTRFEARVDNSRVHFTGKGWGHGVGLCQEGAFGMAQKGYSAFDILRHYYRGIMVEKMERYQ